MSINKELVNDLNKAQERIAELKAERDKWKHKNSCAVGLLNKLGERCKRKEAELAEQERLAAPLTKALYKEMSERHAAISVQLAALREAVDTELVCCHIGTLDSMKSPKHAVAAIARWHYDLGVSGVLEGK